MKVKKSTHLEKLPIRNLKSKCYLHHFCYLTLVWVTLILTKVNQDDGNNMPDKWIYSYQILKEGD